jgi:predicted GIY-YIG superfamily endonuclease
MPFIYILKCADDSFYTGQTTNLAKRLDEHQAGIYGGYTSARLPIVMIWSQEVQTDNEAFLLERKVKGWSRAKKKALIRGDFDALHEVVKQERRRRETEKKQQLEAS